MSLQTKLNRFRKDLTRTGSEREELIAPKPDSNEISDEWNQYGAQTLHFEEEHCILREKVVTRATKIGDFTIQDYIDVIYKWNKRRFKHPLSAEGRSPEDLLFFDTETTGLGTGTGNMIFLLGMARVQQEGIQVRQYFLPGPGNEVALYHHFLNDVQEMKNLVTYNGKAFDWPQVKTRHTFVRDTVPKLPPFGHFDLLHGARRIWKKSYDSLRLSFVEKELLNIQRNEDTPGYLAPMLYFEFLREKDPTILEGVFKHNELDVLTLIALYVRISNILLDIEETTLTTNEQFEVAKWFEAVGEVVEAGTRYQKLLGTTKRVDAIKALAFLYKKEKDYDEAVALWETIIQETDDVVSYIELSKAYEHKYKDLTKALFFAEQGYRYWKETTRILRGREESDREEFLKRIERLHTKLG